jgi:N utilization substance protein A
MDLRTFRSALEQLEVERGIPKSKIIETIELALAAAYKRDYGKKGQIIKAKFNPEIGKAEYSQIKIVVDESMLKEEEEAPTLAEGEVGVLTSPTVPSESAGKKAGEEPEEPEEAGSEPRKVRFNPERHIMLEEAKKIKKGVKPEDELIFPLEAKEDYGRIAAQTAKQVIIQRIREAERESVFDEYKGKQGEIISGIVQRIETGNVFLDLGRTTAILPREEQIRGERYRLGERVKALLFLVDQGPRGINLYLSRSHPRFLTKLFEMEVPEIANGVVDIKNVAREAGSRAKIAVFSKQESIDPVGSCVGQKGVRVGTVISELGGEKIDIIEWSEEPNSFIANALSPAKVLEVEVKPKTKEAKIMVAEDQVSLAIGKGGQNVRLAAKLTGWKLDIRSRTGESIAKATEEGEVSGEGIQPSV